MRTVGTRSIKGASMPFILFLFWSLPAWAGIVVPAPMPEDRKPVQVTDANLKAANPAAKEGPSKASELTMRGNLLLKQGKFDEAIGSFDAALALHPHMAAAKTGKGAALSRKGELAKAEEVLKDALLQNPDPVSAHYELGLVYEKMGDLDRASTEYKEGIKKHEQGRR
jgi:tetratricopeptide (TPR) repeat protein